MAKDTAGDSGNAGKELAESCEVPVAIVDEESIRAKMYEIRGQKVMLDFELAEIYGYSTTAFKQQVKNNAEKFDEDFMFQITRDEWTNLMSKKLTSSWGGRRKLPHAFTEQGVYMLMTVLKGELAVRQSKALTVRSSACSANLGRSALSSSARLRRQVAARSVQDPMGLTSRAVYADVPGDFGAPLTSVSKAAYELMACSTSAASAGVKAFTVALRKSC